MDLCQVMPKRPEPLNPALQAPVASQVLALGPEHGGRVVGTRTEDSYLVPSRTARWKEHQHRIRLRVSYLLPTSTCCG